MTYFNPDESTEVDALMGAFFMVRKEAMEQVGLLDDTFFMYGEDLDWSYRLTKAGWKIWYFAETKIIHHTKKAAAKNLCKLHLCFILLWQYFIKSILPIKNHYG